MSTLTVSKAIREGLHEEMVRDDKVVILEKIWRRWAAYLA